MVRVPMKWSKLKSHVEGLFADGVRGRVRLHTTHYRGGVSFINGFEYRSWITIDGQPIINMHRFLSEGDVHVCLYDPRRFELGLYNSWDMQGACEDYLTMSIDDAFATENTLIRAFAVLDRRAGTRRLKQLHRDEEIPLVRYLLAFRRAATIEKNKPAPGGARPHAGGPAKDQSADCLGRR